MSAARRRIVLLALGAALLAAPWLLGGYFLYILSLILIYALAAFGTDVLTGQTNLISIAGATFFGVGAYVYAILVARFGLPFPAAMLLAAAASLLLGLLLAIPVLRLEDVFLAIATLGFVMIFGELAKSGGSWTGGASGMAAQKASILGWKLDERAYFYVVLGAMGGLLWLGGNLNRSRFGRAFNAIKGSEIAARALGVPVARMKIVAFSVSAGYCGAAGALYAPLVSFVDPSLFDIMLSINFLAMVIVGGLGSIWGAILGAAFVAGVPEILKYIGYTNVQRTAYGVAMILALMFLPRGLVGLEARLRARFARGAA